MPKLFDDDAVSRISRDVKWGEKERASTRTPGPQPRQRTGVVMEWFRITAATRDGSNKRWTYTAKRADKTAAAFVGWGNHASDTSNYTLYNLAEAINTTAGTYGNGVTQANLTNVNDPDGTVDLQAIPDNSIVLAAFQPSQGEWWIIGMPNGVDGACPS